MSVSHGVLTLLALGAAACAGDRAFECADDAACAGVGVGARCEPAGFCSAADPRCPSGRRYGERAGDGLGGACVESGSLDGGGEADAGVNLVPNPSFEAGLLGWDGYQSEREISDVAHQGASSASVCAHSGTSSAP